MRYRPDPCEVSARPCEVSARPCEVSARPCEVSARPLRGIDPTPASYSGKPNAVSVEAMLRQQGPSNIGDLRLLFRYRVPRDDWGFWSLVLAAIVLQRFVLASEIGKSEKD